MDKKVERVISLYNRVVDGEVLVQNSKKSLTNSEILTVCNILLESRSLTKEEMYPIVAELLNNKNLQDVEKNK